MNLTNLKKDLLQTESVRLITESLGEIAAIKLKANRKQVETNSKYFNEILAIYKTVKVLAIKKNKKYQSDSWRTIQKNGKTISILLSSNHRFNGNLDTELVDYYQVNTAKFATDRLIIGKIASELLTDRKYSHSYKTLILAKDHPSSEEFNALLQLISPYSKIYFYYCKFETVLSQKPAVADLSPLEYLDVKPDPKSPQIRYILEPEIDKMINFFESQILSLLINSIFLESDISQTAARMNSMDQAQSNAQKQVEKQKKVINMAKRVMMNEQILEIYSARKRYGY